MKRVTIKDVAKRAGVTHATVSMVVNNDKRITENTKQKVQKAIQELNYHPNRVARSLVTGKTHSIAIVMRKFYSMFGMDILEGLEEGVSNTNYDLNLYSASGDIHSVDTILSNILHERKADAVIVLCVDCNDSTLLQCKDIGLPVVIIEGSGNYAHIVKVNNIKGSYTATEHLINHGRKKIGFVIGDRTLAYCQKERFLGYKKALLDNSIDFDENLIIKVQDHSYEDGKQAFQELKKMDIDAVFCAAGDWVAAGIQGEAKNHGIRIPEDIALIGHDDMSIASILELTTLRQPNVLMGKAAFELAFNSIDSEEDTFTEKVFETELICRNSG